MGGAPVAVGQSSSGWAVARWPARKKGLRSRSDSRGLSDGGQGRGRRLSGELGHRQAGAEGGSGDRGSQRLSAAAGGGVAGKRQPQGGAGGGREPAGGREELAMGAGGATGGGRRGRTDRSDRPVSSVPCDGDGYIGDAFILAPYCVFYTVDFAIE
ncbi:uncharacterized protein LOC131860327 [Cryptomeria japonica]|uniref:uncharacterized protein LOC131860327 n=1 Tax=Cryptomeria japonica TaxID=3369 RepID=UPI0027DA7859|nr:uncharacterized protein LOC131860327 [Cryptomeria japonica]